VAGAFCRDLSRRQCRRCPRSVDLSRQHPAVPRSEELPGGRKERGSPPALIPCIDLQNGQAVQLVHGRRRELAVADVFGLLEKFRNYKWLHIIDLDAAMNKAPNTKLVRALCVKAARDYKLKVRVGGGIRTLARATSAINAGARQI